MVNNETVTLNLTLGFANYWSIQHVDVYNALLNGLLLEDVYMDHLSRS